MTVLPEHDTMLATALNCPSFALAAPERLRALDQELMNLWPDFIGNLTVASGMV